MTGKEAGDQFTRQQFAEQDTAAFLFAQSVAARVMTYLIPQRLDACHKFRHGHCRLEIQHQRHFGAVNQGFDRLAAELESYTPPLLLHP